MSAFWRFLTVLLLITFRSMIYVGLGFLAYGYFVADHIDWSSAWFWAYLLAWPFILIGKFIWWIAVIGLPVALVMAGIAYAASKLEERNRRVRREARQAEDRLRRGIIDHERGGQR